MEGLFGFGPSGIAAGGAGGALDGAGEAEGAAGASGKTTTGGGADVGSVSITFGSLINVFFSSCSLSREHQTKIPKPHAVRPNSAIADSTQISLFDFSGAADFF